MGRSFYVYCFCLHLSVDFLFPSQKHLMYFYKQRWILIILCRRSNRLIYWWPSKSIINEVHNCSNVTLLFVSSWFRQDFLIIIILINQVNYHQFTSSNKTPRLIWQKIELFCWEIAERGATTGSAPCFSYIERSRQVVIGFWHSFPGEIYCRKSQKSYLKFF